MDIEFQGAAPGTPMLSPELIAQYKAVLTTELLPTDPGYEHQCRTRQIFDEAMALTQQNQPPAPETRTPQQIYWNRGARLDPYITKSIAEDVAGPPPEPAKVMASVEATGRSYLETLALARAVEPQAERLSAMNLVRASEHAKHLKRLPPRPA
jgi:hypothetical protein